MKVDLYCPDITHPTYLALENWISGYKNSSNAKLESTKGNLHGGDLLVLISVPEILSSEIASRYRNCLVIHGSNLPRGKGWSPIIWELLSGEKHFTISLIEASHPVDSGKIWHKVHFEIPRDALFDEIQNAISSKTIELIDFAIYNLDSISPKSQVGESTFFPRRTPDDSELDPSKPLEFLFDQIRASDPNRYPAFFRLRGKKYKLIISEHS